MKAIGRIWANRIEAGTQEYSNCPSKYQPYVLEALRDDVENEIMTPQGVMTPELFEQFTGVPFGNSPSQSW